MTIIEFKTSLIEKYCKAHNIKSEKELNYSLFYQWVLKRLHKIEVSQLYDLKDEDIYSKINEVVTWYHLFGRGGSIDELLDAKDQLLTLSYRLYEIMSDSRTNYKVLKKTNENLLDIKIAENKDQGPTIARSIGKSQLIDNYKQEIQYEVSTKQVEDILKSVNEIAKAMTQRIAWLRQEYNNQTQF
jgi:hypothetical protein